ncbi:hypothetical protein [Flavobacterium sp. ASV13]|uniref:hypothetical protein n=1 Tax=Flavobacterium sp. ASV13 TaxID=1506583 RepID=UPI000558951D|nr:hypothetical protein [Flavobacterium sp. ASV13]
MFKRKFKNEFDFSEESFLFNNEKDLIKYDRSIFVVYEKNELLEFLKMDKKGRNVLVCLFNKQLYSSLSLLDEINNLIVLDNAKTRPEIVSELKQHLTENSKSKDQNKEENFFNSSIFQTQFNNFYKGLFFLM